MKALVQTTYGLDAIELAERPIPEPAADQVRIKIEAASLNPADWHKAVGTPYFMRLTEGLRRPKHEIIGTDGAGVIDKVGAAVKGFEVGDRVFGSFPGAYAEYAVTDTTRIALSPGSMSDGDASGLPIAGVTALESVTRGKVEGKRVVISGASGGVGMYAVQIAKAFGAAHITGVCSGRNEDLVRSLGADDVIDYTVDDYTTGTYDVLIDLAGTKSFAGIKRCLAPGATWLMVGPENKDGIFGPLGDIVAWKTRAAISRIDMQIVSIRETSEQLQELADLAWDNKLRTVVDRTYTLDKAQEAYRYIETRRARGKVLLEIG